MKRFECKNCGHFTCRVFCTENLSNKCFECKETIFKTKWYEIAEEEEKKEIKAEEILNLPSWCKVGEVVYFTKLSKYCKVIDIDIKKGIKIQTDLSNGWVENFYSLLEARLRPFNEQEIRELVGKVIACKTSDELYLVYYSTERCIGVGMHGCLTAKELLNEYTMQDGSPCGKCEHLDNGEWVE